MNIQDRQNINLRQYTPQEHIQTTNHLNEKVSMPVSMSSEHIYFEQSSKSLLHELPDHLENIKKFS